ncbi:MAG: undecaprenyl-diphosphate phosphatase [Solirubrobacterales bacterium]|jgi:undecaprenyl-diphosphatase|nr:undecaprenyl-diphosphate phosphatase [Solirubrobacterales bacterium]
MPRPAEVVLLGLVQGPAELLPISSSGHVAVLPWLLGWSYADADPELRKSVEVALHAGTAAALLIGLRGEVREAVGGLDPRRVGLVFWSFLPPALAGLRFERVVEEKLGTPSTIAAGLLLGSALLVLCDRVEQRRGHEEAGWVDAVWLGVAQAASLMPGVSRNGATLAAGRARGFRRSDANVLSRHSALPVILGASVLKGVRLTRRGIPMSLAGTLAAGALASFASTLACIRLIGVVERDRPLAWWAAYRCFAAGVILTARGRRGTVR